ncbi:YbaB/EbfC DNA-binding family protein [Micromonospora pisi]|uniref:YbaB/EbfC DNA-binding family protein n=1 Tax=Micromonospora pisi TaxID=589240 RepID=A0A495JMS8_9ACTN|nr:YbaB/EbfC family nucleoid-associated protein [Micromonospora pisi]RKR89642.1 YbaB/EbfC DNA-binding family protein [Micromonospora pisi]
MLGEGGFERQLVDVRALLRETISRASEEGRDEPGEYVAEAADGRIRVTVGTDGRVGAVEIDPRVLREGAEYLADEFRTAVNAALDGRGEQNRTDEPVPDLDALNSAVERLQDQSIRQMREMTATIGEVMRKLHKS